MKYLLTFSKQGYIKYISHLDMIRLFNRCFKRAGVDLKHSQGFNPHPKLTFAQPLSLGYTSTCELAQIDTKEEFTEDKLKSILNKAMPEGIDILYCEKQSEEAKSIASLITEAGYAVMLPSDMNVSDNDIKEFISQKEIISYKKQKRKKELKEINIKPMIRNIILVDDNKIMKIIVDCGSSSNLNPEVLLKAFFQFKGREYKAEDVEISRITLQ